MNAEDALPLVLELAEQNALIEPEIVGDEELQAEFERQHEAFEVVQNYIDTDFASMMPKYTTDQIGDALELVWELGSDNVLDDYYVADGDRLVHDRLVDERERQLEAVNVIEDHITNHFGDD